MRRSQKKYPLLFFESEEKIFNLIRTLIIFYSAFATSFTMEWVNNKFGRKITAIFGALVGIFGCLWMRYGCIPGDPSVQYHVFFVAILLGITNLSLIVKLLIICCVRTQRPRIDLNKRFLPRSNTTTA